MAEEDAVVSEEVVDEYSGFEDEEVFQPALEESGIASSELKKDNFDRQSLLERIQQRRDKLSEVSQSLKAHFVGLDDIIDKIIENIEVWYVLPEVITRPVIVNLWGMTGVGKTDLVRRLVRGLGFGKRFVEVQLTNRGETNIYGRNLQWVLASSNLEPSEPGVLLLDEIQRFRTVNEHGSEIHDYKFQDLWMLLSDGMFSGESDSRRKMLQMVLDALYYRQYRDEEEDEEDEDDATEQTESSGGGEPPRAKKPKKKQIYMRSYWTAQELKRMLKLEDPVEQIMRWSESKRNAVIVQKLEDPKIYEGDDYSRLMIFISGNLDEAYTMADACGDSDGDADIFHAFSKRINMITIKAALTRRFKPEQIARFGNCHVIYPSLSRSSYEEIIRRRVKDLIASIQEKTGITIHIDPSVNEFIYRNGVFPAQGVRPLFSTISSVLESSVPQFLLEAVESDEPNVYIRYDDEHLVGKVGGSEVRIYRPGDLDVIKKKHDKNIQSIISVHEAGHALAYGLVLGISPTQVLADAKVGNSDQMGFIGNHRIQYSRKLMRSQILIGLAGIAAEEIVYGKAMLTDGCEMDISNATALAGRYVRKCGMWEGVITRVAQPHLINIPGADVFNHNTEITNNQIDKMVDTEKRKAYKLIRDNIEVLRDLVKHLMTHGMIEPETFKVIFARHGIEVSTYDVEDTFAENYYEACTRFIDSGETAKAETDDRDY